MNLFAAFVSMFAIGFLMGMGTSALIDRNYKLVAIQLFLAVVNIPFFLMNLFVVLKG